MMEYAKISTRPRHVQGQLWYTDTYMERKRQAARKGAHLVPLDKCGQGPGVSDEIDGLCGVPSVNDVAMRWRVHEPRD